MVRGLLIVDTGCYVNCRQIFAMPGCAASNCTSHSRKKIRLFRFPRDPIRRRRWEVLCRRRRWKAT